jgi:membrane-bound lytic murein transglycosylase A
MLVLSGCAKDKLVLKPTQFSQIDGWAEDSQEQALGAFLKSCKKFDTMSDSKSLHASGVGGTFGHWRDACGQADTLTEIASGSQAREFFEVNFTPYVATNNGKDKGLFTGYFEADLEGSYKKHDAYKYPIYKKPRDLVNGEQYYSREQIAKGALAGKNLELVWVKDPVKAFFMEIQGSGRVHMEDGSTLRVGYDGKNGHAYIPIGRVLIDRGYVARENMSAQAIKKFLYENPGKAQEIMNENPSYVFFRKVGEEGPIGAQGVPLTPFRSLAVDRKFIPYGAPVFVNVNLNGANEEDKSFKKLLIAQDTGGAIRGPVRGDLFFGYGKMAEDLAGYQNSIGKYYLLLPKAKNMAFSFLR